MFKMIDSLHQYRPIHVFKDGILDICLFKNIVKKKKSPYMSKPFL